MDELLTADDAAKLIGISSRSVRRYADAGQIEQRRVGRKVLFLRASVEAYARDNPMTGMTVAPTVEMVPQGPMLELIERYAAEIARLNAENGYLRGKLETVEAQLTQTPEEPEPLAEPEPKVNWWRKLIGGG
jgi:excisionase family DNA binding protein